MSDDRIEALERTVRSMAGALLRQGERLVLLEEGSRKLEKIGELDRRVTGFADAVEAARRERKISDLGFKELRGRLQLHEARLVRLERKNAEDDAG